MSATKKTKKETKVKKKTAGTRRRKRGIKLDDFSFEDAIEYKMDKSYELKTPIHHKVFGNGVVQSVIDDRKIEILFEDGAKIMVQNYHP